MVSETLGGVHQSQAVAQRPGKVILKQWRALLAAARQFVATERTQRHALHALVLTIGALSFVAVV